MRVFAHVLEALGFAFLVMLATRLVLFLTDSVNFLIREVKSREPEPRPRSPAFGQEIQVLISLAAGLLAGIVFLASPAALAWVEQAFPFVFLAALVPVGAVLVAERVYDVWQRRGLAQRAPAATNDMNARVIELTARFVDAFRPEGAPEYYDLLYGRGQQRVEWFTPSPEQLRRCLAEYDALLKEIAAVHPVYALNLLGASEVCLGYVDRAWRAGLPLPPDGRSAMATLAAVRVRLADVDFFQGDWRERMWSLLGVLEEMAAGRPPQRR